MKFLFSIFLALCAMTAHAVEFEAGLGVAQTQRQDNGTWYQEGFPYSLDLTKKAFYLGVREQITPTVSAHVDYVNFGILHTDAIATTDDNYDPVAHGCKGTCVAQSHFVGSGRSDGLKVAAQWMPGGDKGFGLIGGVFLFKPSWKVTVYDWTLAYDMPPRTIQHSIQSRWTLRPVIGVSYRIDRFDLRLEHYFNKPYDSVNTGITKSTTMLSLGYSF